VDAGGVMCVQVTDRGKWHVLSAALDLLTPCGEIIPVPATRRALDLIDSDQRCRAKGCIEARNKARGLS
jgi:hypothetical protein